MSEAGPLGSDASNPLDAHGQAALVLVESLIHVLIQRCVLTLDEAIAVLDLALDSQKVIYDDAPSLRAEGAIALLSSIMASLETDLPK